MTQPILMAVLLIVALSMISCTPKRHIHPWNPTDCTATYDSGDPEQNRCPNLTTLGPISPNMGSRIVGHHMV